MNIQAISPPSHHTIKCGCISCGNDVKLDNGFADLDAPARTFLCARCASIAIGSLKASKMIEAEQVKQLKLNGVLSPSYGV